jgi:hypothetical protein
MGAGDLYARCPSVTLVCQALAGVAAGTGNVAIP